RTPCRTSGHASGNDATRRRGAKSEGPLRSESDRMLRCREAPLMCQHRTVAVLNRVAFSTRSTHLSAMNLLALRTCQGGDDARVIGWPQAGRRPIGWFVADEVDVLHCECAAQQNQVDTVLELRLRIQQIGVLATRGAGPLWVPSGGQSCIDKRLVN